MRTMIAKTSAWNSAASEESEILTTEDQPVPRSYVLYFDQDMSDPSIREQGAGG